MQDATGIISGSFRMIRPGMSQVWLRDVKPISINTKAPVQHLWLQDVCSRKGFPLTFALDADGTHRKQCWKRKRLVFLFCGVKKKKITKHPLKLGFELFRCVLFLHLEEFSKQFVPAPVFLPSQLLRATQTSICSEITPQLLIVAGRG